MMQPQNYHFTKTLLVLCAGFILSCSSEGDDAPMVEPDPIYIVSDLDTTIEENPETGTVLGTLSTDLPGTLTYTSSNTAFDLDVASLEVLVADKSAFDYELNTTVTGTINLSNGEDTVTATITINLTDFEDAIENLLTSSKDAFIAANIGDWIEITEEEFTALETSLEDISYSGVGEGDYPDDPTTYFSFFPGPPGSTVANSTDELIPAASYLFAVRMFAGSGIFTNTLGNKIKISETANNEGFQDIGTSLPEHTTVDGKGFFVLKGNTTPTVNSAYLGIYVEDGNGIGAVSNPVDMYFIQHEDATDLSLESTGFHFSYQGLSTTKLQWE
ncbi:MAG: cadherin repeat domain-containing protein [Flavobacteriaceae bacterium]